MTKELGWEVGQLFCVKAGTDSNAGCIRIEPDENGWRLITDSRASKNGNGARRLRVAKRHIDKKKIPGMPDRLPPTPITARIESKGLEFRLPWAKHEETVDEAIANGKLTRVPPAFVPSATMGNPVRQKAGHYSGGRVR
jgi:hypothetical protein